MARARPQHNVLLLLTDQWRHDALGCAGNPLAHTPHLDRLAEGAARFTCAFTPTPLCSPARASLLTGRWPHQTGVTDNFGVGATRQGPLAREQRTWLEAARDAGFRVGYFGKWHLGEDGPILRGAEGWSRGGFDRGRPAPGTGRSPATEMGELRPDWPEPDYPGVLPGGRPPFCGTISGTLQDTATWRTATEGIHFLRIRDDRPWFMAVSFHGPHFPHLVPEPYADLIDPAEVPLPASLEDDFAGKPWFQGRTWWPCHDTSGLSADDWRRTAAAYYGAIAMLDAAIGSVLAAARDDRPTAIVFTSDHGEMLGAHGRFDKGPYLYDEVLRVPLIIRPPEGAAPAVRDEFVNLLDVGATLFALTGEASPGSGRNLLGPARDDAAGVWPDEAFGWYESYNGHSFVLRSIRTRDWKYCFVPQAVDELYDLHADPHELTNLASDPGHAPMVRALRARLFAWMHRERDPLANDCSDLPPAGSLLSAKEDDHP